MSSRLLSLLRVALYVLPLCALPAKTANAQVCCPGGCVQDGTACVTTGPTPRSCQPVACSPPTPRSPSRGPGVGAPVEVPILPSRKSTPQCCDPTRLPRGSYSKTCRNIEMHCAAQNEMVAVCRGSGHEVRSTLPNVSTCRDVVNKSGYLKCNERSMKYPPACY